MNFTHTAQSCDTVRLSAFITTPDDYDPAKESLPMIFFLHGQGERGDDLEIVKGGGIARLFKDDPCYKGVRAITVSPQCPDGFYWTHFMIQLKLLLEEVIVRFNADRKRIAITGLSMGGFGTWEMLMTYPELFSCGAPVCGGGIPWNGGAFKGMKLRVFHGVDDNVVPVQCSVTMVNAARRCGADVDFFTYDKVGHASWVPAYEESDLLQWLTEQSL